MSGYEIGMFFVGVIGCFVCGLLLIDFYSKALVKFAVCWGLVWMGPPLLHLWILGVVA